MSYQEDQINEDHIKDFQTLIDKNPQGMTFIQMFDRLPSFVEQTDLSKCIHAATQRKICAKIDGKYFPFGCVTVSPSINVDHTTEAIRDLLSKNPETSSVLGVTTGEEPQDSTSKVVQTHQQLTKIEPLEAEKVKVPLNGNLRRSSSTGKLAYLLWRCRGEAIHRKDIKLVLDDVTAGALYQSFSTLIHLKMIQSIGTDAPNAEYTWSGVFGYPFPNMLPMDKTMLPFHTHEEFLKWKQNKLQTKPSKITQPNIDISSAPVSDKIVSLHAVIAEKPTETQPINTSHHGVCDARELINIRIMHHENELIFLNKLLRSLSING